MRNRLAVAVALLALATSALVSSALAADDAAPKKPVITPEWAAEKAKLTALGKQYPSAEAFYADLEKKANGGKKLAWTSLPDWSGIYTRPLNGGIFFDLDQDPNGLPPAKYTPEYQKRLNKYVDDLKHGIEYDPLSVCESPTFPRWLTLPFLREHIVTPNETWMIAEAFNVVRRIYTDGRGHVPKDDRYPLEAGDSIGFWDGDKLVIHTNQNMAHMYERAQGFYSDEAETVEIWRKLADGTLIADTWVFDPPALREPWFARQRYVKIDDQTTRLRHWSCKGNPNNDVTQTPEGGSQFKEFTFEKKDGK